MSWLLQTRPFRIYAPCHEFHGCVWSFRWTIAHIQHKKSISSLAVPVFHVSLNFVSSGALANSAPTLDLEAINQIVEFLAFASWYWCRRYYQHLVGLFNRQASAGTRAPTIKTIDDNSQITEKQSQQIWEEAVYSICSVLNRKLRSDPGVSQPHFLGLTMRSVLTCFVSRCISWKCSVSVWLETCFGFADSDYPISVDKFHKHNQIRPKIMFVSQDVAPNVVNIPTLVTKHIYHCWKESWRQWASACSNWDNLLLKLLAESR